MGEIKSINELLDQWGHHIIAFLPKLVLAIITVFVFYFLAKGIKKLSLHFYSKAFKDVHQIAVIISNGIFIFMLLSGIFIALEILGLESVLAKLLAGAGVVGIVAGFAFKDIASNAFAGLLLTTSRPFKEGDWVAINSDYGKVISIGWITTAIQNIAGQKVYIPNQIIFNQAFSNFSAFGKRRVIISSGVSYGDDLDFVKKVAMEEVATFDTIILQDGIECFFTEIGSSTFNFQLRYWIKFNNQVDFMIAQDEAIRKIKKRFEVEDISIAYSVMTLDFGVKGGTNLFDQAIKTERN